MQFVLGLLIPLLFLFSVMMYLADFRVVCVAFAAAGCLTYFVAGRLNPDG